MPAGPDQQSSYTERLWVPVGWWVLTALFALSLLVAVLFYLGPVWGIGAGLLVMIVMGGGFLRYGRAEIRVRDDRLWAAGANIEWEYVAGARSLDEPTTRRRRGPESDARAYLVLRPYLTRAVEVTICDASDPTPYWLINSRRPDRLAAAVNARCGHPGTTSATGPATVSEVTTDAAGQPGMSPSGDTLDK